MMKAGDEIRFTDGFYAEEGSYINAIIGSCDAPQTNKQQLVKEVIVDKEADLMITEDEGLQLVTTSEKSVPITSPTSPDFLVFPNPFRNQTALRFVLAEAANVQLQVRNALGQRVSVLENSSKNAGVHRYQFAAGELPSGLSLIHI